MSSVVNPGVVKNRARSVMVPARYPVSSSSSRMAHSRGSSPSCKVPAGSSINPRPAACRYWRMRMTRSGAGRATMHTAPGCTTISRRLSPWPPGSSTRSSRTVIFFPAYTIRWLMILASLIVCGLRADALALRGPPLQFLRFQYRPQSADEFINLLFGDDERRQHA